MKKKKIRCFWGYKCRVLVPRFQLRRALPSLGISGFPVSFSSDPPPQKILLVLTSTMDNYSSGHPGGEEGHQLFFGYAAAGGGRAGEEEQPPSLASAAIATTRQQIPFTAISYSSSSSANAAVSSGPSDIPGDADIFHSVLSNGGMFVDQEETFCDCKSSEYEHSRDLQYSADESSGESDMFVLRRRDTVERSSSKSPPVPYYGRLAKAVVPMDLLSLNVSSDGEEENKKLSVGRGRKERKRGVKKDGVCIRWPGRAKTTPR